MKETNLPLQVADLSCTNSRLGSKVGFRGQQETATPPETVEVSDFPIFPTLLGQRQGYSAMESALQRTINSLAPPAFAFAEGKKQDKRNHEQMAKMDDPH